MAKRPTLYASSGGGGRHATWLELFFDLVFVLAIAPDLLVDDIREFFRGVR